jgi:solute carrier family 25 (mitochondrial folate transporter), member 32
MFKHYYHDHLTDGPLNHIASAVCAALVTDVISNPLWMIKVRLQTQSLRSNPYNGIFHAAKTIVKTEGVTALWAGCTAQFIGASHVAVQFPLYEILKKHLASKLVCC